MLKEELIQQLVIQDDIAAKFSELTKNLMSSVTSTKLPILSSRLLRIAVPFFWCVFTSWSVMLLATRSTTGEKL